MLNKPLPSIIKLDLGEMRAAEDAVDSLPYGSANPRAKEVEAQAIAEYRKAKAEKERLVANQRSQG
ncbi:hypothetical protein [Prosthecobacter sp.]|uniref:hypothetical protein n=1 Tax=Prosthecobacter sp. TaxID=1965333 RepID=UPI003783E4EA